MDALAAVTVAGLDRETLREALAATLVKDEHDRAAFDRLFDIAFPLGGTPTTPRRRRQGAPQAGEPGMGRGRGGEAAGGAGRPRDDEEAGSHADRRGDTARAGARASAASSEEHGDHERGGRAARR